eukprot:jgi/Tetstr1/424628/TSEL_015150.t1
MSRGEAAFLAGAPPGWPKAARAKYPPRSAVGGLLTAQSAPVVWEGTYAEGGMRKVTKYSLTLSEDGTLQGSATDADGQATVTGSFNQDTGRASWKEITGRLKVCVQVWANPGPGGNLESLTGLYAANTGVWGELDLIPAGALSPGGATRGGAAAGDGRGGKHQGRTSSVSKTQSDRKVELWLSSSPQPLELAARGTANGQDAAAQV